MTFGERAKSNVQILWKTLNPLIPLIAVVPVIFGTIYAVQTELRHEAAAEVYSKYIETILAPPKGDDAVSLQSVVQATLLLHASDEVIEQVYILEKHKDGLKCTDTVLYDVIVAMKEHVGVTEELDIDTMRTIVCGSVASLAKG